MFITFEGGEGVGKTTLINEIQKYFINSGKEIVVTREPGGTKKSEQIREILLTNQKLTNVERMDLFVSARIDHNLKVIAPALKKQKIVLCDRYFDSTFVYQGILQNQKQFSICVNKNLRNDIAIPDLTFILDLDPLTAQKRISNAKRDTNFLDDMPLDHHEKLRQAYIKLIDWKRKYFKSEFSTQKMVLIDASQSKEEIFTIVLNYIKGGS